MFSNSIIVSLMLRAPMSLAIHDGHGRGAPGEGETWWHYLTEAEHLPLTLGTGFAIVVLVVIGGLAVRWAVNKQSKTTDKIGP